MMIRQMQFVYLMPIGLKIIMKLTGGDFINLKDFKISIVDENGKLKDF